MFASPPRIDLHCHSIASNKTSEAVLNAIHCPESYSDPEEVYKQATRRGMSFVTLTDHDAIDGAQQIAHHPNVLIGEELTCWFPEDACKMHVLVWGITEREHAALQSMSRNIYDVADYIESAKIAHAVAHPIYRQNERLERWHLERLLLLFKGFECLNGAHSPLHREAFEPVLDRLTPAEITRLSETHALLPKWQEPWLKARTAGSDDHGLLNVGRTWTEFPDDVTNVAQLLDALREGRCKPGGEAGGSAKLAHTFYSVAVRYYSRHILSPDRAPNIATSILQALAGEKPAPSKPKLLWMSLKQKAKRLFSRSRKLPDATAGTNLLKQIFLRSAWSQLQQQPQLREMFDSGLPPLGEHDQILDLIWQLNRDVTRGMAKAIDQSIDNASFTGLFDNIGALLAQQFTLLPYYFALFHQNKERHLLPQITRFRSPGHPDLIKVGLFTDTFDEINGVSRFLQGIATHAEQTGRHLQIHVCSSSPATHSRCKTFEPILSRAMPLYEELQLRLPPVLELLEWADRQQFDVIHASTPGPMGLCGWLASKMLRVPMLATYHTDFPAYVDRLAGDHRVTNATLQYMKWFYGQAHMVFARSNSYLFNLRDLGISDDKLRTLPASIATDQFNAARRDSTIWSELSIAQPKRILYVGRVSVEKNLPLLVEIFKLLTAQRKDIALIVAGDGPYRQEMQQKLADLPARFLGFRDAEYLSRLYASSDLFVFPSRTETLGQVVMEAQASGLPAIVSNEGGPKEIVAHNQSGLVIPSSDPRVWCEAISNLLDDESRRIRMADQAARLAEKWSTAATFDAFWAEHIRAGMGESVNSAVSPSFPLEKSPS